MAQAIEQLQDAGVEADVWKIEGLDRREDCERIVAAAHRNGRDKVGCIVLGRGEDDKKVHEWLNSGHSPDESQTRAGAMDHQGRIDEGVPVLRQKRVADFMRTNPTVVHETDSAMSALKIFKQAAASMLPVVNEDQLSKGWLRLDFVLDLLHQGKAGAESAVSDLLILPSISAKPDELVGQVLLSFAQTADREFAVENTGGQLIGTLALLDLVLADGAVADSSAR